MNDCAEKIESIDIESLLSTYDEIIESYEEYKKNSEDCVANINMQQINLEARNCVRDVSVNYIKLNCDEYEFIL